MDKKLLKMLVCPLCKNRLEYDKKHTELICVSDMLAYPIVDGVPLLLEDESRHIDNNSKNPATKWI